MRETDGPVPLERLLGHREWVRQLALALVRRPDVADDVAQETWLASLRSPPRRDGDVRGWLARVVRSKVIDRSRSERRRRGDGTAPAEPRTARSTADAVAEAETHALVAQIVTSLDEPYRTTLVLRYFEDLPPREIAARTQVPVETVRTRTRRALDRVRRELGGDRRSGDWIAALAPLLPSSFADGVPTGATGGLLTWGAVMGTKLNVALVGALALVIGAGAGWTLRQGAAPDTSHADALAAKDADIAERDAEIARLEDEMRRISRRRVEASSAFDADSRSPEEPPEPEVVPAPIDTAYPSFPDLDETLAKVEWDSVGVAVHELAPILGELLAHMKAGTEAPPELIGRLQMQNAPLIAAVVAVMQDLPGIGPSGDFTHPAFTARTIDATLAAAERPLDAEQVKELERIATSAIADETLRRSTYPTETLALRKLYDELDRRGRFLEESLALLSPEQRDALHPESVRGHCQADLFCEGLQWSQMVRTVRHRGGDDLANDMFWRFKTLLALTDESEPRVREIVDDWASRLPESLRTQEATGLEQLSFGEFAKVKRGATATLELAERLLREADLTPEERANLLAVEHMPIPFLKTERTPE